MAVGIVPGTPRVQGKVGQVEDPPELKGRWSFYLKITFLGIPGEPIEYQCPETFDSELIAKAEMRDLSMSIIKRVQKEMGLEWTGNCFDLKNNRLVNYEDMS